jgi:zinc transporter, ZIP family
MLDAFGLGVLAQSSLLLAGLLVCWITVPTRLVGILAGFGAGAMISAIAFDLVPEAQAHIAEWQTVLWMLLGVAIFLLGDWVVDKRFGTEVRAARWASSSARSSTACRSQPSSAFRSAPA